MMWSSAVAVVVDVVVVVVAADHCSAMNWRSSLKWHWLNQWAPPLSEKQLEQRMANRWACLTDAAVVAVDENDSGHRRW